MGISTILGFVNECKDTFDAHSRLKNVKTSVNVFLGTHGSDSRKSKDERILLGVETSGLKRLLENARDAILNCVQIEFS